MLQPIRHHIYTLALVIAASTMAVLCACSSNDTQSISGYGWITMRTQVVATPDVPLSEPLSLTISTIDGAYSGTWDEADKLSPYETFQSGEYTATLLSGHPGAEGYGCPCYAGMANFMVTNGHSTPVSIQCSLQQVPVYVDISGSASDFTVEGVTMHTSGFGYNEVETASAEPLLIMPGRTFCYMQLRNTEGKTATISMSAALITRAAEPTGIDIAIDDNKITLSSGAYAEEFVVTPDIWSGSAPAITAHGFQSGLPISLIEGYPSTQPLVMDIVSDLPLHSATLTLKGSYLSDQDIPADCSLLDVPRNLLEMGLIVDKISDRELKVDFTRFIENLNVDFNDQLEFSVEAIDAACRVSDVCVLKFTILSVDLQLLSVTPAVLGENYTTVTANLSVDNVESGDFTIFVDTDTGKQQVDIETLRVDSDTKTFTVGFFVPEGIDPVKVEAYYMDNPKMQFEIPRRVPDFSINIDAFAHSAVITVGTDDANAARAITTYANIYANGLLTTIVSRDQEKKQLKVIGLKPACQYDMVVEVIPDQFAAAGKTITEADAAVPMGDFEDFEFTYDLKKVPSGGTYSSASFPIYTNQNFTDFAGTWVTKYWASVNDKTLCKEAKHYNTWYIQPSADLDFSEYASGLKSVHLMSVGWSLDGQDIPPYMQAPGQRIPYSANVPARDHTSAGKLFLGSYAFDASTCTETYNQGIAFSSRPSSLNGFYKYLPDINHDTDVGLVVIELVNDKGVEPQTIAHAEMKLGAAPDFVSFNVPLEYTIPNLKATRLRIMFATSDKAGSIEDEDAAVPVSADIEKAIFAGSQLWIDNLSFSY